MSLPGGNPLKIPIDPNGNLATKTEGTDTWTYTWNAENQLTKVEKNGAEVARFGYDPLGRRVEKVAGGVTTGFTYDGHSVLREIGGATTATYVHAFEIDEPLAVDNGAGLSYFHGDALGSIVKLTNATGAVALTRQYDAWGGLETTASESGYGFTGREWDPATGLYYYRARYYDPRIGRFISADPIGLMGGAEPLSLRAQRPREYERPVRVRTMGLRTMRVVHAPVHSQEDGVHPEGQTRRSSRHHGAQQQQLDN